MNNLLKAALRQQAVFVPEATTINGQAMTPATGLLTANLARLGFGVSESLLHALNGATPGYQATILEHLREVMGVKKNWTPLVKNWSIPTGESYADHVYTFFANVFNQKSAGPTLHCGHIIPVDAFPPEKYNGCPFCGTPFEAGEIAHYQQNSKVRVLELWTKADAARCLENLLTSKTALDASQQDTLKLLLSVLPLPAVKTGMKETMMTVVDFLVQQGEADKAQALFITPTDILRYLWYKHTGMLQIIEPKTIIKRKTKNSHHFQLPKADNAAAKLVAIQALKLKYGRKDALTAAKWLNNIDMEAEKMCEIMHPKRNMWVRFIRALRLAEFSHRKGFERLHKLMDVFYNQQYEVWQGRVDHFRLKSDAASAFYLLKQRPGMFARSLYANMLWFGADATVKAFADIVDKVPARLLFTLQMYAAYYFDRNGIRAVKPLGGISKTIPANTLVALFSDEELKEMEDAITDLCALAVRKRFMAAATTSKSIYIAPELFKIPLPLGDRSEHIQDLAATLMGTRFPLEGDAVRLFMQWGTGLPAQHMDMDLSCRIIYDDRMDFCSYSNLTTTGCQHSGDIRQIPHMIGTAEYIELNLPALAAANARYVVFTCNAYSGGEIVPNLIVGWMNSQHRMKISAKTGVAYDPSCVQHQVRITSGLTKGLVFGVLDVAMNEIIWLELPFGGQVTQSLDMKNVKAILKKLDSKLTIGHLLQQKAEAQQLQVTDQHEADEAYTLQWALDTAAVTQLLID
ncbi:MAG TPA: hypothetical protein VM802_16305 [Chitinophaga sp.]|uniref:hypothetical protein n=1 Tax=Chitinophaga sp. TaxID=1869181 RepID=UPI002BBEC440|nr:hypothetical protein [Chitinophaga sp.]HVI46439.1 hypothetical protein [Chitinophaga sp.]